MEQPYIYTALQAIFESFNEVQQPSFWSPGTPPTQHRSAHDSRLKTKAPNRVISYPAPINGIMSRKSITRSQWGSRIYIQPYEQSLELSRTFSPGIPPTRRRSAHIFFRWYMYWETGYLWHRQPQGLLFSREQTAPTALLLQRDLYYAYIANLDESPS